MNILVWGIEPDLQTAKLKSKYLLDTANKFNIPIKLLGIGHTYSGFKNRLYILIDYLKTTNPEDIILVMDGYDTLFNNLSDKIIDIFRTKNTRILFSAEKLYTYQYPQFQHKYDEIKSKYRYINAGTYIGYAGDLLQMLIELFDPLMIPADIDQGLMGMWMYNNWENSSKVQLDTNCEIFWVTSGDWFELKDIAISNKEIINPYTNTKPFIIHNTGNSSPIQHETYEAVYKNIIGI
jgi:hypothetical protein